MIKGVDISSCQGNVDQLWLANQGYEFVISKSFTGNDGADPFYKINIQNSQNNGLACAAYNFLYPLPDSAEHKNRNPKDQANLHYLHTGDITVAADLEWAPVNEWSKWGVSAQFIQDWTLEYLFEYERISGRKPLVYSYPYFLKALNLCSDFANYNLWYANYSNLPVEAPWMEATIVQDSGGNKLKLPNGIPVDTDYCEDLEWL